MKILYVARQLHFDGLKLSGRSLVRHLATENDVRVCGMIVEPDSALLEGHMADVMAVPADLVDVDVIYMEGGWNDPQLGDHLARLPLEIAKSFVGGGGVLVVADLDKRAAAKQHGSLMNARDLIKAQVRTGEMLGYEGVRYLYDPGAVEARGALRFFISEMVVDQWLEPALHGIDSLLTAGAVDLLPGGGVAASAHRTTAVHINDLSTTETYPWAWASADEYGSGHVAVIGAGISYDQLVDECPDNAIWVSHLLDLLVSRSRENRAWATPAASPKKAGGDLSALIARDESQRLERKSSFLTPLDDQRPDTHTSTIQHAVGKSIAALANTDGGHVVIGVDDDGKVLGLEQDFASVGGHDRDGFERKLVQYLKDSLTPGWSTLGLEVDWLSQPAGEVAIVAVPRSEQVVHLKVTKKNQPTHQAVYVRMGTTTHELTGPELVHWVQQKRTS